MRQRVLLIMTVTFFYKCDESVNKSSQIWSLFSAYGWDDCENFSLHDVIEFRSLADIAELVSLREQLAQTKTS